ncbi:MAG: gliding motility lipoprotein GldH [Flavobacteriaceae bacterium]|nr:gliding motility lipoprotein GldH [Flavobacteriaceae bacterium]
MYKVLTLVLLSLVVFSCTDTKVFDKYTTISNAKWHKDSIINFKFSPTDTLSRNNLYVNLRNNKEYGYSNLFLIVGIDFPNNTSILDTLEYEMADAQGKFLGSGFTDLKENKLEYKTNVIFPLSGEYTINVQHAMRKSGEIEGITALNGITDVGFSIEKVVTND